MIQTIYPQVSTSVSLRFDINRKNALPKFHLSDSTGFPSARGEAKMEKGDCVIPQTLEKNVIELHRFLFGDENYIPTDTVKTIRQKDYFRYRPCEGSETGRGCWYGRRFGSKDYRGGGNERNKGERHRSLRGIDGK